MRLGTARAFAGLLISAAAAAVGAQVPAGPGPGYPGGVPGTTLAAARLASAAPAQAPVPQPRQVVVKGGVPEAAVPPVPLHLETWVSPDDYPQEALRRGEQGIVTTLLRIDATGRVRACAVTETSGSAALDAVSCEILKRRARFRPATDAAGHPIEVDYRSQQAWSIGGPMTDIALSIAVERRPAGYTGPARLKVLFDEHGRPIECETQRSSGSALADAVACRQAIAAVTVKPPRAAPGSRPAALRYVAATFAVDKK
jgi:TonB family protein